MDSDIFLFSHTQRNSFRKEADAAREELSTAEEKSQVNIASRQIRANTREQ